MEGPPSVLAVVEVQMLFLVGAQKLVLWLLKISKKCILLNENLVIVYKTWLNKEHDAIINDEIFLFPLNLTMELYARRACVKLKAPGHITL